MKKNNKFSVIVPVYNAEKYLKKCIDSILEQTYQNYEIIVINDGSTDNSWKLLEKLYSNNNKIKLINKKNEGVSSTRNLGIEKSCGEWITFVDSDDWIEKNTLEEIIKIIDKDKEIEIIFCNLFKNTEDTQIIPHKMINQTIEKDKRKLIDTIIAIDYGEKKYGTNFGNCRCIGGKFYKKSLITDNKISFTIDIVSYEDGIFNLELINKSKKIYINEKALYHYYFNDESRTNTPNKEQSVQNKLILEKIELFTNKNNIKNTAIGYCALDLFTMVINQVVLKNRLKINKGTKDLEKEFQKIKKYVTKDIKFKYLTNKNKMIFFLLKNNMYMLVYISYYIKNKVWR